MKKLRLAGIGCGGRTIMYFRLAAQMPEMYQVIAAADPRRNRVERARDVSRNPDFRMFEDDAAILAEPKMADVMVIGTQDPYHVQPARAAMEKGYDLLLEKPIATNLPAVLELEREALRLGRRVMVCHVLRYAPFYKKVKEIIDSGRLGEIISINATEGVGAWHQGHSFVRGHWSVTERSNPMIIAKSCHDTDIIHWLIGRHCKSVSSYGALTYFNESNKPEGAPPRCTDGCPVASTCLYNSMLYATTHRGWLQHVFDEEAANPGKVPLERIREWLSQSDWGRCVYQCDNTAVDHQTLNMIFEGDATATFTMTAFESGRHLEVFGTKARLRGGDFVKHCGGAEVFVMSHEGGGMERFNISTRVGGYSGHGGGDPGLMLALYDEMVRKSPDEMLTSISESVESHVMGFAAEESRMTGRTVDLDEFRKANEPQS